MKRNTGQGMLIAGNDAAFQAAQDINNLGGAIDGSNSATLSGSKDVSTHVSGNNISIRAGQDVVTKGAQIVAEGALSAMAGRDVRIETANESGSARDEHQYSSGGLLTATSVKTDDSSSYSRNVGSTFSGNAVVVRAGNNVNIVAAN
ncbi:hemagglutinin repeat-containing protein [Herbaspirillum huttiense]|uniref:hemagglutinin repeat-containing protein n=1 Tax=Herbaspirillum huttiense TaxID=863372 RepID=UPI0010657F6E